MTAIAGPKTAPCSSLTQPRRRSGLWPAARRSACSPGAWTWRDIGRRPGPPDPGQQGPAAGAERGEHSGNRWRLADRPPLPGGAPERSHPGRAAARSGCGQPGNTAA